jgi:hypothetical protein
MSLLAWILERIRLVPEAQRTTHERDFYRHFCGVSGQQLGWHLPGVDPRRVVVSRRDGRFVMSVPCGR